MAIQKNWKKHKCRFKWKAMRGAAMKMQRMTRRHLAIKAVEVKRQYQQLFDRREDRKHWQLRRRDLQITKPIEEKMLFEHLMFQREKERANRDSFVEREKFESDWKRWESDMVQFCMRKPLLHDWIPQLDKMSGKTFYMNVKTTEVLNMHPNLRYAQRYKLKQRKKAERILLNRLTLLEEYQERMENGNDEVCHTYFNAIRESRLRSYNEGARPPMTSERTYTDSFEDEYGDDDFDSEDDDTSMKITASENLARAGGIAGAAYATLSTAKHL
eukprot:GFYU01015844.1.p1 GENE.GFYU01015844.1~~GFYU01015844.1.p1  ORF type:complete len:285 (+),score=65.37 GFYU01015844.1:42-857(+)